MAPTRAPTDATLVPPPPAASTHPTAGAAKPAPDPTEVTLVPEHLPGTSTDDSRVRRNELLDRDDPDSVEETLIPAPPAPSSTSDDATLVPDRGLAAPASDDATLLPPNAPVPAKEGAKIPKPGGTSVPAPAPPAPPPGPESSTVVTDNRGVIRPPVRPAGPSAESSATETDATQLPA